METDVNDPKKNRIQIQLSAEIKQEIEREAAELGLKAGQYLVLLHKEKLKREKVKKGD